MELLNFFAMIGMFIDNLLALYSVLGSLVLLFSSFSHDSLRRNRQFWDWSILGLTFGGLGQISMTITNTTPEKVGFILPMSPASVNGILLLSLSLLLVRKWIRSNRYKFN